VKEFLIISVGAALGANLRYWVTHFVDDHTSLQFPYGTLLINVTGSFALGVLLAILSAYFMPDPTLRLLIGTGFLGAFTTFSAFSYETVALFERGHLGATALYVGASVLGSILAAYLGLALARLFSS
jgi:CrcB protein